MASTPWHALNRVHLPPPAVRPTSLLAARLPRASVGLSAPAIDILLVHSQPRLLNELVNDEVLRTWSFPADIVSFCWADSVSSPHLGNTEQPAALVATADGHIWRISLHRHEEPPQQPKATAAGPTELSRVTIKIEDSDDEVEEEEEFELWNDEDGLLEDPEKLDSLSPASKRQRTSSPLPSRAPASHPPAVFPESSSSIADATRSTVKVDLKKHLVGSENDATRIICAFDGLLIFRRDKDPIYWKPQYQLVGSGSAVARQDVSVDGARLETTCYVYERQMLPDVIVVGTTSGAVYKIEKQQETFATRLLCALKEPIASLILVPSREATGLPVLVAIGTMGTVGQVHLQAENSPPSPERSTIKTLKDVKVHGAFLVQAYAYLLTKEHRLLRVTLSSLLSDNASDMERVDLPSLLSCQPILSGSDIVGFYGINCDGQVLRMSADLARWGRPQVLSDARDDISKALGELEGLSWQAKQLEAECQLENHRIARYNQLVQQLKSCVLSELDGQAGDDPPVLVSLTAFTQSVATGFNGSRRCFVRLNIRSAMNVDWSNGWSGCMRAARLVVLTALRPICNSIRRLSPVLQASLLKSHGLKMSISIYAALAYH
ncbi:hypothetical protein BGZ99_004011 [Dissophora globulifera]|uniref:Uncharacterized protein n=1 Tax=Dissophora globulifera TaxID=979702 RepID=A0A9P6V095_9FUNG|nr:hypothetical protein BGZ99_004011 [Dissophora globulifera]